MRRHGRRLVLHGCLTWVLAIAATAVTAGPASARVDAAATIAGPDSAILELGGVAMAGDGTGGVVYRRFADGKAHIYAARYDGGRWHPPQRVDAGQAFDSSWPRIGAADGGRLVVTWVQEGGVGLDGMWSAALQRGASRFQPPTLVDFTIGEARATFPSLAMAPNGAALLAYRVVTAFEGRDLPPDYVRSEIRLARFSGVRWQRYGVPANRNRAAPQRQPTAANSPQVALAQDGTGAIAWQEPDEQFVDRVWARRVFASRFGIPLQASPVTLDGRPVGGRADALAVDETRFGRVVVAVRQMPEPRDREGLPRIYVNQLDETTAEDARTFPQTGPVLADAAGPRAAQAPGPPSLALGGRFGVLLGFARGGGTALTAGEGMDVSASAALAGSSVPPPVIDAGVDARGTVAYASGEGGGRVVVHQLDGTRPLNAQGVAGPVGGPVRDLAIAGSGTGDALVAFVQGESDEGQVAVARVHAPPVPFTVHTPPGWVRELRPLLTWDPPPAGFRPRSYTVEIDGRPIARTAGLRARLQEGTLADGRHEVRVIARSAAGETTSTRAQPLLLDHAPPAPVVRRRGMRVTVRIDDGRRGRAAGPAPGGSTIRWGDGRVDAAVGARRAHRYRRPGAYRVTVRTLDRAGNRATTRLLVRVSAGSR
jgi:hypothetical protein